MTRIIVEPARTVFAHCALGHKWQTTLQIERDTHLTKNPGRRGFFKFHSIYRIDRCPECGHQQMGCSLHE